jgi:signal peptidase I
MFIWIAVLIVVCACAISIYNQLSPFAKPKPAWLLRLQYASVFAGSYLVIQYSNAIIFLSVAAATLTIVHVYDRIYTAQKADHEVAVMTEISRDMWLFVLLFCLFRSLVYDYSAVPSGSMEPTLYAGDLLAVNKMAYQSKIPPFHTPLVTWSDPKVGDVIVFLSPMEPNKHYIKRVIAGPNDRVVYKNKKYYVNGKEAQQFDETPSYEEGWLEKAKEDLNGVIHGIQLNQIIYQRDEMEVTVPKDHYFVSGDNRDHSYDSRYFGPIHKDAIVGKASHIITQFSYPVPLLFNRSGSIQ